MAERGEVNVGKKSRVLSLTTKTTVVFGRFS